MRYSFDGFYDKCAKHGEPTGSGPTWDTVLAAYKDRQLRLQTVGTWRTSRSSFRVSKPGGYIDPDYYIVDWEGGTG